MQDRFRGYVDDVGYTFGYCPELNPMHVRLAFLHAGLAPPAITATSTACELGFGQGLSLGLHAAGSTVRWFGTDLLPAHVESARALCAASGSVVGIFDASFAEFSRRTDLPTFDFIGMHGVLSWVSAETRAEIAAFVRDRLAPDGVVYASCNALPGWADLAPLRELATQHAVRLAPENATTVGRIEQALVFMQRFLDANPAYATTNPRVRERFGRMLRADPRYLAHEYFNRDWHPLHFSDAAALFETAGLQHACAAHYRDQIDALALTREQRALLTGIPDRHFRETVRDFATNQQFRRDYWVRAPRTLGTDESWALWRETRIVLVTARQEIPARVTGERGEVRLADPVHEALVSALSDHRPHTVGEVEARLASRGFGFAELIEAVFTLAAFGHVMTAQDDATMSHCASRVAALNASLFERASRSDDIGHLASAVTAGGVPADQLDQLFISAIRAGGSTAAEWIAHARAALAAAGEVFATDDGSKTLAHRADHFAAARLPVLRELIAIDIGA